MRWVTVAAEGARLHRQRYSYGSACRSPIRLSRDDDGQKASSSRASSCPYQKVHPNTHISWIAKTVGATSAWSQRADPWSTAPLLAILAPPTRRPGVAGASSASGRLRGDSLARAVRPSACPGHELIPYLRPVVQCRRIEISPIGPHQRAGLEVERHGSERRLIQKGVKEGVVQHRLEIDALF